MKNIFLALIFLFSLTGCQLPRFNPSNYLLQPSDLIVQVKTETGAGTGTIVSYNDKIFVLTAGHVVDQASEIELGLVNGQTYTPDSVDYVFEKDYLGKPGYDLAILDISDSWDHPFSGLNISSVPPKRKQNVHVIGYPLGLGGKDYQFTSSGEYTGNVRGFDTYNTPCAAGCSGAAILNDNEEVLGVLIMGYPSFSNLILAVPHKLMKKLIKEMYSN